MSKIRSTVESFALTTFLFVMTLVVASTVTMGDVKAIALATVILVLCTILIGENA